MNIRLFIKPYCGWCHAAMRWLDSRGVRHEKIDMMASDAAWDEMVHLSGQDLVPVIEADGHLLVDFGPDELAVFFGQVES